jgi:hypothetical protein
MSTTIRTQLVLSDPRVPLSLRFAANFLKGLAMTRGVPEHLASRCPYSADGLNEIADELEDQQAEQAQLDTEIDALARDLYELTERDNTWPNTLYLDLWHARARKLLELGWHKEDQQ